MTPGTGRTLRAVVFDVGGCLWFDAQPPRIAEVCALQAAAVRPLFSSWRIAPPEPLEELVEAIWEAMEEGYRVGVERETYREPSLPVLWRGALASSGVDITEEQATALWRTGWIPVRHFGYQLFPDAIDVLHELKARGYLIGLCTNRPCTNDMLWPDLDDYGLAPFIDFATCSGDVGYFKPHAAPFEHAMQGLGVEASEAMMVGDSAEADVRGAKTLGMPTAWKLNGRYGLPECREADFAVHDLCELLTLPVLGGSGGGAVSATPHEDANEDRY
jgi:HAD superfamily hydrolase (TIGR01509 family)